MNKVVEYIKANGTAENPVTSNKISGAFGISGSEVRNQINKARCEGYPVCSCGKGYYYSEDKKEIIDTIQSLVNRTISVEKAINGLLKNL